MVKAELFRSRSHRLERLRAIRDVRRVTGVEGATRRALLYFVVPLWQAAAIADWYEHRRTRIETTAGARESAIHLLMLGEAGLPSLLGLFLEVNAGVLLTAVGALVAHEITAIWDVAYAEPRRQVTPTEQHIHSLLEVVPLMAVTSLTTLHWDQARALVGVGQERAEYHLRPKRSPLGRQTIVALLALLTACGVIPYLEEFVRCWRADPRLSARPVPRGPAGG